MTMTTAGIDYRHPVISGSHFAWGELIPREVRGQETAAHRDMLCALAWTLLDPLRERWGEPLHIHPHGALRPEPWNTRWEGAPHSLHRFGAAADPHPENPTPQRVRALARLAEELNPFQLGVYDTFVHIAIPAWALGAHRFSARWNKQSQ